MEIIKIIYYILAYSLQFFMWLVIGRVAIILLSAGKRNILVDFFIRFTNPIYDIVQKWFPASRVPEEKKNTMWGFIDGYVPFIAIVLLWLFEKILRILVGLVIVNMSSQL